MTDTVFTNNVTLTDQDWFNDVNRLHYTIFGDPSSIYVPARIPNIPVGAVDYGSLGTVSAHTAGSIYVAEIFVPYKKVLTGMGVLMGTPTGTDKLLVGLYGGAGGTAVAVSVSSGSTMTSTNQFYEIAFTTTYTAYPGMYWAAIQCNSTTDKTRRISTKTYLNATSTASGSFGALPGLTVPTSRLADCGPIVYVY